MAHGIHEIFDVVFQLSDVVDMAPEARIAMPAHIQRVGQVSSLRK
jgi:hypothetical protein